LPESSADAGLAGTHESDQENSIHGQVTRRLA
jgi:hypothetical protein